MAMGRIEELQAKVTERAGGTIRCPICGEEAWTPLEDTVLMVLASSHDAFRRANDGKEDSPPENDDHWSVFAVGAFCENCGFFRMHAVSSDALLA
jgi:hypothetical protein